MLYIEDDVVYITQNDDAVLEIDMQNTVNESFEMEPDDFLTLTVRQKPSMDSPVLLAVNSAPGSNRIVLRGADTLEIEPGKYSFDVQLTRANGERFTVLPDNIPASTRSRVRNWRNFIVMPQVTTT